MYLFLISFLSLYGGIHLYAFYRLRAVFSPGWPVTLLLSVWMVVFTLAPLLVRLSEEAKMDRYALMIAWPGYVWMGFVFILVSALFVVDLIKGVYRLAHHLFSSSTPAFLTSPFTCECAVLLAFAASGFACYEALQIRSEQVVIHSSKLPSDIQKIRIVQVSDVHIGLLFREERLERVLKVIREAKPDIIVSTGDLVDGKLNREDVKSHQKRLAEMLASVPAPSGKYAVTGNHESYAGLQQALAFTSDAGFTVLRNQSARLSNGVTITGVDDQALPGGSRKAQKLSSINAEKRLLETVSKEAFHLLLKHRPDIPATSDGLFDLQLSGHVHKGQIFPFNFLVKLEYSIPCGTTTTSAGSRIHVSRGTGTWGPPMRLFAPPEVTVIDIVPTKQE
ncbi:MAG: metallophosphoesterase [Deltaproteobacteria bacterium]